MTGKEPRMTEEKNNTVIPRLCSYQGNFDCLAVGFGQLVQMSEVNRFDADFQQVDNIGRNAGKLFDLRQRQMRADTGFAQLARNAVSPSMFC